MNHGAELTQRSLRLLVGYNFAEVSRIMKTPDETDFLLSAYHFDLPNELIAQFPAERRDNSRLLVWRDGTVEHAVFSELPNFLRAGDLLVRNNTQVIPARLFGKRASGGQVEILLIREAENYSTAENIAWLALAKPAKKLSVGEKIAFADGKLIGEALKKNENGQVIWRFPFGGEKAREKFFAVINEIGALPLPPYINRPEQPLDRDRYQTLYAKIPGAVAAPTAGLHFTAAVNSQLLARGAEIAEITLQVGPGTFKPISAESLRAHQMDFEDYEIPEIAAAQINRAIAEKRRIIAVGTTSARALESASEISAGKISIRFGKGRTDLFIMPGYEWRICTGILTNFHLPQSSLLTLLSALIGREEVLKTYREAIARRYRFYSYGDASLFLPDDGRNR